MSAASVNLRNLVYKLCEGLHVPLLVTDMIAGYLVHRDVFKISVLSRSLNAQANTILYTDIVIDLNGSAQSTKKASLLFRTLLTSESAVQAVRTLSLTGDSLQDWREELTRHRPDSIEGTLRGRVIPGIYVDLNDFTQKEIVLFDKIAASNSASMRSYISEVSVWALLLHVLRVAPQVQELKVSSDYFRFDDFRSTLQDVARGLSTARLRSCSMCLDLKEGLYRHASVVKGWDNVLLALFAVPGIQSMATAVSLESGTLRHLRPGGSSITRLVLHHYQIEHCDLSPLLAATSGLKYLEYRLQTDHASIDARCCREAISEHRIGLEPLFGALNHVGDSLQELHTFQEIDEDSIHFSPGFGYSSELVPQQRGEMTSLKQLRALTVPYSMLLGWSRKDCVWEWNSILPSSLRRIVLTDDLQNCHHVGDWTDDDLMPIISSLVEWLASPLRGDGAAAFGLDLEFLDADFTEPVRQELPRMCEERGVRCDIEKVEADRPKWALPRPRMARPRGRGHAFRGRGRGV